MRPRIQRPQPITSTAPPITLIKQIGNARLFSRNVPGVDANERRIEYGAEYRNAVYYAATPEEAIRGLKRELVHRISLDEEILTLQSGIEAGLDETCIQQFCLDNQLDPAVSLTRRELRQTVLKRRSLNCTQYRAGLVNVKIFLNCR